MIALFSSPPQFCPNCGSPIKLHSPDSLREALGGVAQVCIRCHAITYVIVHREQLLNGAGLCDTDLVDQVRIGGE